MRQDINPLAALSILAAFGFAACAVTVRQTPSVPAVVETEPVHSKGDAGDDMCIWLHPTDLSLSTIIGTDSSEGLAVYDLAGRELAFYGDGATGMVDVRYNFPLGTQRVALVAAGNHADNRIALYKVDHETRELIDVSARTIQPTLRIYGTCMYYSMETGNYYVVVTSQEGEVEQWRLFDDDTGKVDAELIRKFTLGTMGPDPVYRIEGCVADDQLGRLYLSQEIAGRIWRLPAEPMERTDDPFLVDRPQKEGGQTAADVEGLSIYYKSDGTGYLLASNQGSYAYTVYTREGNNAYLMTFKISGSSSIDAATSDDSIDVTNVDLGATFPKGLFVVEDGKNTRPGSAGNDNYKLVGTNRGSCLASTCRRYLLGSTSSREMITEKFGLRQGSHWNHEDHG